MAKPKPTLFEVRKSAPFNGKEWRVIGYVDGKRKQYWFSTKKEAKKDADDRNQERTAYGSKINLDADARFEAAKAANLLKPYGKTILDAVQFYLEYLDKQTTSITASELCVRVLSEFERRLAAGEIRKKHYTSMLETVRKFRGHFAERQIKLIDGTEVKAWLATLPLAVKTRKRHYGYVKNMFGLAQEWNLIAGDPFERTNNFKDPRKGHKVEILTPEEMKKFLGALHKDWLPFFAINAFTGLRREEISRLDWSEVKLDRNLIDLPMEKSKNGKRKLTEVPKNLLAILTPFVKSEGRVMPKKKLQLAMESAVEKAGIVWKQNCLRHSFCSYAVATHGLEWTADQADHSISILRKDYREKVTKEDADRYWAILPA